MTAANTSATVAFVFRRRYADWQAADITMRDHPSWKRIDKRQGLGGQDFVYTVKTGNPQGIGNTFSSAKSADGTMKGEQFVASDVQKYFYATIDGPSMLRNQANNGKIIDLVTGTLDGGLLELGNDIAFDLMRDGTGQRGRRLSAVGNIITLVDQKTVDNFKRGMTVIASPNANGSTPRTGSTTVDKLNRQGKALTLADASQIVGFSDNDYLFRLGAAQNSINGMGACTPLSAPTVGTLFRNVERNNDLEALAGTRLNEVDTFADEVIGDLAVQLSLMHKRITRATIYPTAMQSMVKRLGAKVQFAEAGGTGKIGFQEIMIYAGGYAVPVTADPDILPSEVRVWDDDCHHIAYLGPSVVHFIRDDGLIRRQLTDSDGFWVSGRFVGDYLQPDPSAHGVSTYQA